MWACTDLLMYVMLDLPLKMLIVPKVLMMDNLHCWDEMITRMMDTRTSSGLPVSNDEWATRHQRRIHIGMVVGHD